MQPNSDPLIRIPLLDTKQNYLSGFWRWIELLAAGQYEAAATAVLWSNPHGMQAEALQQRIHTFFGGDLPWYVVVPNERLQNIINDSADVVLRETGGAGWMMVQLPLTTTPGDAQNDALHLVGLACTFFVLEFEGNYVLQHEMFHI
jgi:hypothetical protein